MTSYYVGNFSTSDTALEALREVFVSELGWISDEDGVRVWCDKTRTLGLAVTHFSNLMGPCPCTDKYTYGNRAFSVSATNANIYLDYVKSKDENALLIGAHTNTSPPLKSGSVIIAETTLGQKIEVITLSNSVLELESGQITNRSTTLGRYTAGNYVSLFKLPSLHGGIFKEVYGVYSFSGSQSNAKVYIDGDFYQLGMNASSDYARLAIPVSN